MENNETHSHSEHGVHVCYYKRNQSVSRIDASPPKAQRHKLTLAQDYTRSSSQVLPVLTVLYKILKSHINIPNDSNEQTYKDYQSQYVDATK
jgi:hypothetical protein